MRVLFLLILLCSLSACTSYRTVSPADLAVGGATETVRLVPYGEPAAVLEWPTVVGDSIVGRVDGVRHAYAVREVAHLDRRKLDGRRTAATAAGGLAVTWAVTMMLAAAAGLALLTSLFSGSNG